MALPRVTIIVTQRERFSLTQTSLESILSDYLSYPFELIYVDGNSPPDIQEYLQTQADNYSFITLIRREHYLRSNTARNIALPLVKDADYIVFVDNDDIVEPGWLRKLVDCAEAEDAAIVTPLILQGQPNATEIEIHVAGIETRFHQQRSGKRWFEQKQLLYGIALQQAESKLVRKIVDAVEFHCVLVRASIMKLVQLDEIFDSLASHNDLCFQVDALGGKIFLEPSARVIFLNPRQISGFTAEDVPFYLFKWSEQSTQAVFKRMARKWNIASNDPSIPSIWRWVIENRQLPIRGSIEAGSLGWQILDFCYRRNCPSWLRTLLEYSVLKRSFPAAGLPSNLEPLSQRQLSSPEGDSVDLPTASQRA
jgi:glycosyltransferase involved in cell wall biosynthesis